MENEEMCCPKFDPSVWQEKEIVWKDKLFLKDSVKSFMHIPLNMGTVIERMQKKIMGAGANVPDSDFLILSDEASSWKSEQLIPVAKEVTGMENVKISGTFLTKVFDGPYKEAPNWYKEMQNYVKSKDKEAKKIYMYYTTCPKCAKKYGHNYIVVFAQVD